MASAPVTARPPWERIVAAAAVASLALWFVEIKTAFGLPAHPLLLHVPVVFVPILGLATLALVSSSSRLERYGTLLAGFAVVTFAATLLTVGAGEALLALRPRPETPTLHDHGDAGEALRFTLLLLTAALVGLTFRLPTGAKIALRVAAIVLALAAIGLVIRTGHLGAKLAWDEPARGGPPPGAIER